MSDIDICMRCTRAVQSIIGYEFQNPQLLWQALDYSHYKGKKANRLDYVGDKLLGLICAELCFHKDMNQTGPSMILNSNAFFGRIFQLRFDGLTPFISNIDSIDFNTGKHKANVLEGIFGAIYFDGGIESCKTLYHGLIDFDKYNNTFDHENPNYDSLIKSR